MSPPPDVSLVIPVYGSEATLVPLVERITRALADQPWTWEAVFIDDASPDNAWQVLQELQARDPDRISAVQLMRNFGQHNALMCGLRQVRGRYIVTLDDDLQNPPEEIPNLVAALQANDCDLMYGVPRQRQHTLGRTLGSRVVNAFFRLVFRTRATVTSFRAIRRELVDAILTYDLNFTFLDGLLAWNTQRIGETVVEHHPRSCGRSGYSFTKLLTLALNLFTNFSLLPLQMASGIGVIAAVVGLGLGAYYLLLGLLHNISVPGYASTIVAIMVLGGLQLLGLGIIGEYVGRLHLNVNRKPQYSIRAVQRATGSPLAATGDVESRT